MTSYRSELRLDDREFQAALDRSIASLRQFSTTAHREGDRVGRSLAAPTRAAQASLGQMQTSFRGFTSTLGRVTAALGVVAGASGLGLVISRSLAAADEVAKMSTRLGVAAEALQEYQHGARLSGVANADLETGLRNLNRRIGEAAAGEAEAVKLFREMGISATTTHGQLRSVEDVLGDFAERIKHTESPAVRTRLAMEAFGRSGTLLLPMLERGRAGLAEFAAEARRLGVVLDERAIRQAERTQDAMERLAASVKTNITRAVLELAPAIEDMSTALAVSATAWKDWAFQVKAALQAIGLASKSPKELVAESITSTEADLTVARRDLARAEASPIANTPIGRETVSAMRLRVATLENQRRVYSNALQTEAEAEIRRDMRERDDREKRRLAATTAATALFPDKYPTDEFGGIDPFGKVGDAMGAAAARDYARVTAEIAARRKLFDDAAGTFDEALAFQAIDGTTVKTYAAVLGEVGAMADAARDELEGLDPALAAVGRRMVDVDAATRELNAQLEFSRKAAVVFGESFDAASAEIAATEDAIRSMLRAGLAPSNDQVRTLTGRLQELRRERSLKETFVDIFGSITGAFEKMSTGIITGTLRIRDAFRTMGQSIVVEIVNRVIRQALNPLIDTLARVAAAAVNQFFPGAFVPSAAGGIGLSAGLLGAAALGAGAGGGALGASVGGETGRTIQYGAAAASAAGGLYLVGQGAYLSGGAGLLGAGLTAYGTSSGNEDVRRTGGAVSSLALLGDETGIASALTVAMNLYSAAQALSDKNANQGEAYGQIAGTVVGGAIGTLIAPGLGTLIGAGIGGSVGGWLGGFFGRTGVPHEVREAREVARTLGYAGGAQGDIARSRSLGELYATLTSYGSGATGGTSPVALIPYIDRPSQFVAPLDASSPHAAGGFGFIGNPAGPYPTIGLEQFKSLAGTPELDRLRFNIQAGVTPGTLDQGNAALAETARTVAKALLEVETQFQADMRRLETRIVPFLAGAEVGLFREALTSVRAAFDREGGQAALDTLTAFEEENKALVERVQAQFQTLQQALGQGLAQAFQATSVDAGIALFGRNLKDQVLASVTQGLMEAVTASAAFQGIVTPALQPIRDIVNKIATAEPGAMTADFFGERRTELQGVLAGVAERLGPLLPVLREITLFTRSLPGLEFNLPAFPNGGVMPGFGDAHRLALVQPGEVVLPRGGGGGGGTPAVFKVVIGDKEVYDSWKAGLRISVLSGDRPIPSTAIRPVSR